MGNAVTRTLLNIVVTLVVGFVYFYVTLPAINLQSEEFYAFALLLCIVYCVSAIVTSGFQGEGFKGYFQFVKKQCLVPAVVAVGLLVIAIAGSVAGAVIFRARSYAQLLPIETGDFVAEVDEISYNQIPMLDKDSAERLGDRKLGELSDMVSQFEVNEDYTQINYQGRPVRIATLSYADIIKWITNRSDGLPAYLIIDMVDQSVELVRLEEGIKYTTAEHFGRNLYRHLRFRYPTFMFAQPVMEVDEEGTPYWVCARLVKTIGLFGGVDVKGGVLVNAITGESQYYEEVPPWVDNLYNANLITQQYDYYGMYHNGFFNSIFGQRDVTITTEGYNYIAINDDVYVYTGITSTGGDQSNIGFILTNQRTKETKFYSCAGATEYSAMDSAKGELQNLRYNATFPLLLNVGGQPTYFMAMKDAAELVKKYAMVNVQQYTIVATGDTVAECEANYLDMLRSRGVITSDDVGLAGQETATGTVAEIRSAVLDGNSVYFVRLVGYDTFYSVSAVKNPLAVILSEGDQVEITYVIGEGSILEGTEIKLR
ncbi:MAG: CvpA family protein [Oscillospiraceae bacterium]|nr:CvpA family protein [Oscillospiraceae bacterium]